jgi:ankyrin repeat protein
MAGVDTFRWFYWGGPSMENSHAKAFEAVRTGDLKGLAELLASDPSVAAARDENGLSLLMRACYQSRWEMVEMLRGKVPPLDLFEAAAVPGGEARGAELLAAGPGLAAAWSPDGFTALHLASFFGREPMAGLLLERGADPDAVARNAMRVRPLHSASASHSSAIVRRLLDSGADVNAKQNGGWTPLHAAAMFGDLSLLELLLDCGADPSVANDDGKTALDMAAEKGHAEVLEALRSRAPG